MPIPDMSNLPGNSRPGRPGGGGGGPTVGKITNEFSFKFDGVGSYFSISKDSLPAINGIQNMSYSLWIKPDDTTTSQRILSQYYQSATRIEMAILPSNRITFNLSSGTLSTVQIDFNQATPEWAHLVMSFDGTKAVSDRVKIFLNGEEATIIASTSNTPALTPSLGSGVNSRDFNVGALQVTPGSSSLTQPYDGFLDELAFWNRSLVEEEAKAIYDATNNNPGKTANLDTLSTGGPIAWYRMGD